MNTDITRQISASVYEDMTLREKIYMFMKDPYHAVVDSYGINTRELLKHVCRARRKRNDYYIYLVFPSLLFWMFALLFFGSPDEYAINGVLLVAFGMFVIISVIVFLREIDNRKFLRKNLSKNSYNDNFDYDNDAGMIEQFHRRLGQNVVFYSGYTPFVGSGLDIGGWSFVVDIDKGKREWDNRRLEPLQFKEKELYETISKELSGLDIPNLTVKDKVFVNGKCIRDNRELLPDILRNPIHVVAPDYIRRVMNNDIKDARFYKVIQIVDWQGDLVLTNFLRLKKDQKCLSWKATIFCCPL